MKDSHREPMAFMRLQDIVQGKLSVFVHQTQLYPYGLLGAAGCWSIHAWMGPSPLLKARDACMSGNWERAKKICMEIAGLSSEGAGHNLQWRENTLKLAINEAGYCHAGPLRAPFRIVPNEVTERAKELAAGWRGLCQAYPT
jgi:dihydrodipicolinate synthase/N-acetylneuraminate lyase